MPKPRVARKKKVKKKKKYNPADTLDEIQAPKSFIFRSGPGFTALNQLISGMKKMMLPYTAQRLNKSRRNTLKDFQSVAGPMGVSHFLIFSKTEQYLYFRVARLPQGPTLTFTVDSFSNCREIQEIQKKPPVLSVKNYDRPPLVVLNNFNSDQPHLKLTSVVLQNMFPVINVSTIVLRSKLRVVLFDYDKETNTIEMRHYLICLVPTGLSKTVKQLVWKKEINMGKMDAIEYLLRNKMGSESDLEDTPDNKVKLPVDIGVTVKKHETRAIRLLEIGPRMTFRLLKIEEGFCEGFLIYHLYLKKTLEERKRAYQNLAQKKKEREKRKALQQKNVEKKLKDKSKKTEEDEADDEAEEVDDSEYYRREVGEEPEPELFSRKEKTKEGGAKSGRNPWWKNKKSEDKGKDSTDKKTKKDGNISKKRKLPDTKQSKTKNPKKKFKKK